MQLYQHKVLKKIYFSLENVKIYQVLQLMVFWKLFNICFQFLSKRNENSIKAVFYHFPTNLQHCFSVSV